MGLSPAAQVTLAVGSGIVALEYLRQTVPSGEDVGRAAGGAITGFVGGVGSSVGEFMFPLVDPGPVIPQTGTILTAGSLSWAQRVIDGNSITVEQAFIVQEAALGRLSDKPGQAPYTDAEKALLVSASSKIRRGEAVVR